MRHRPCLRCGHSFAAHNHYHRERYCGLCVCLRYQRWAWSLR